MPNSFWWRWGQGYSIVACFLQQPKQLQGLQSWRRSPGSSCTGCSKQLLHSLISFLTFPRDSQGLSTVSREANLAIRLQQLPLNSHGGQGGQVIVSSSRGKGEFLLLHWEHSEVFWPRWVCSAPSSSALLNLAFWLQIGKKQAHVIGKKNLKNFPPHPPPWVSLKWHYWELHQICGYWYADVTVFHCIGTKMTAFPCLFCT